MDGGGTCDPGIPLHGEVVAYALAAALARGGDTPHAGALHPDLFFVVTDVAGPW
jgi:hypothetical protein